MSEVNKSRPNSLKYKNKQTGHSKLPLQPTFSIEPPDDASKDTKPSASPFDSYEVHTPKNTTASKSTPRRRPATPLALLKKNQSTDSIDSGIGRGSSQTSLSLSCRTSEEVLSTSNLIDSSSQPPAFKDGRSLSESPEGENVLTSPKLIMNKSLSEQMVVEKTHLSDIFKAFLKLTDNAVPLSEADADGPYTRRRKSTSDSKEHPHPDLLANRRKSALPFLHSMVGLGSRNRKTSGCIICDRKRKQTVISSSPSVIIKTSMSRRSMQTRRFSEALQVLRRSQSDLPYVELVVLDVQELRSLRSDYRYQQKRKLMRINESLEEAIEECVTDNMPAFNQYTDWTSLTPHLYSKRLLSRNDRQKLLNFSMDNQRGNYFYIDLLPTKGEDAYYRLYECLKSEDEHKGHTQLLKLLDNALLLIEQDT